jgi:hypothetical protein
LQWLRGQDPPCPWDRDACLLSATMGEFWQTSEWVYAQEDPSLIQSVLSAGAEVVRGIFGW